MGEWSEDGRTLTCTSLMGDLPGGSLVTWTLNPAGASEPFANEDGVPLATTTGSFTTAGGGNGGGDEDCDGLPDDWGSYLLFKQANYAAAQGFDATKDFTLNWNAFAGAGADDYLALTISDQLGDIVFQAPDFCLPRELPVSATSVVIPANTLVNDRTYHATLAFGPSRPGPRSEPSSWTVPGGACSRIRRPARCSRCSIGPWRIDVRCVRNCRRGDSLGHRADMVPGSESFRWRPLRLGNSGSIGSGWTITPVSQGG